MNFLQGALLNSGGSASARATLVGYMQTAIPEQLKRVAEKTRAVGRWRLNAAGEEWIVQWAGNNRKLFPTTTTPTGNIQNFRYDNTDQMDMLDQFFKDVRGTELEKQLKSLPKYADALDSSRPANAGHTFAQDARSSDHSARHKIANKFASAFAKKIVLCTKPSAAEKDAEQL